MSLTADLVLKNEAAASRTFTPVNVAANGITRLDAATTLAEPTRMVINHTTSGKGDSLIDRHLIQFTRTELDANDVPYTTIVNLTIANPRKATGSATVKDLLSFLKDLIDTAGVASADVDKILQGQS
jgi:hypothetical protein